MKEMRLEVTSRNPFVSQVDSIGLPVMVKGAPVLIPPLYKLKKRRFF